MTDDATRRLGLPYLAAAQAQKHVTLNEGLQTLDALVQLSVIGRSTTPPGSPAEGDRYIVVDPAGGAWTGRAGQLAEASQGGWVFHTPRTGWLAYVEQDHQMEVYVAGVWSAPSAAATALSNVPSLGIGAAADSGNPLTARLNAALFTARGAAAGGDGDVRVTLDRETSSDTASILMSTAYAAQAELGLTGDDRVRLKFQQSGAWSTALCVTPAGRLGVGGNYEPAASLDVHGAVKIGDNGMNDGLALGDTGAALPSCGVYLIRRNTAGTAAGAVLHVGGYDGVQLHVQDTPGALASPRLTVSASAVSVAAPLWPAVDAATPLGASDHRFSAIYSATSVVVSSDGREKHEVRPCDLGLDLVRRLQPCSYRREDDAQRHYGLVAQEVEAALGDDADRFGGLVRSAEGRLGLRYEQFIPVLLRAVAELADRLDEADAAGRWTTAA